MQIVRSRAHWTTVLADRQGAPIGGSPLCVLAVTSDRDTALQMLESTSDLIADSALPCGGGFAER